MTRSWAALAVAVAILGAADAVSAQSPPPPPARAAGYLVHTFFMPSGFTAETVDAAGTYAAGFQWYPWRFFSAKPPLAAIRLGEGGLFTDAGGAGNAVLATAGLTATAPNFVGRAFGGGFYAEAEIAFQPAGVDTARGWPSWWSMALEHLSGSEGERWRGQADGFHHFIEADAFEYDLGLPTAYGGAIHDWYGVRDSTCHPAYCHADTSFAEARRDVPEGTDWRLFHRYGLLWVPATATTRGALTFFFDGKRVGAPISWARFTEQPPPPGAGAPWTFGVIDSQHLVLILGAGSGLMSVRSVDVWQSTAAANLSR